MRHRRLVKLGDVLLAGCFMSAFMLGLFIVICVCVVYMAWAYRDLMRQDRGGWQRLQYARRVYWPRLVGALCLAVFWIVYFIRLMS